jgi:C-terminal processing protease CtpA/Prc
VLEAEPGKLEVVYVMRNSPAASAGWRAGERICAVDGAPLPPHAALPADDWPQGMPGRTVRLKMCDGVERTLTLRRFY